MPSQSFLSIFSHQLNITYAAHIDGTVTVDGATATSGNSGGGSGGSVLLEAENFSGHGTISSQGGKGSGTGSGGSGGRIAVHVAWRREYQGN